MNHFSDGIFYNFYKVAFRIVSNTHHTVSFKLFFIVVVEFVSVAMAFLNVLLFVDVGRRVSSVVSRFVSTKTHCTTHIGDILLLFHNVDNIVVGLFVHLSRISIAVTQHVAGKFYYHHLHS